MDLHATPHPGGGYRFLPAISAYSAGVAAASGYEIAALRFLDSPTLSQAFERIDRELARRGLVSSAMASLELRSPGAFTFDGFVSFNNEYLQLLEERGIMLGEVNPVGRTNVIPVHNGPAHPTIFTAFIVQHSEGSGGEDFVVSGAGEIDGDLRPENIVARGDISEAGLKAKAECVLNEMNVRLKALGSNGNSPNTINVYTAHGIDHLTSLISDRLAAAHRNGFVRWMTRPPVQEIEFEMDCKRFSSWRII
jgi:hypothetical protein